MIRREYIFTFFDYWHMGSGYGEGAHVDSIVVKSDSGLPYIPGKTVKGLFREAVTLLLECEEGNGKEDELLFGSNTNASIAHPPSRYETEPGILTFSSASLGKEMENWAGKDENQRKMKFLFREIASTALDSKGMAQSGSLRVQEVAVPLTLSGEIGIMPHVEEEKSWNLLKESAPFIRYAGSHRHRGLGRVQVTIKEGAL